MKQRIRHSLMLDQGGLLRVREGRGLQIIATEGELWITQEGDIRDLILKKGDSVSLENNGLTVIQALSNASLALAAPRERELPEPRATFSLGLLGEVPA